MAKRFRYPLLLRITLGFGVILWVSMTMLAVAAAGDDPKLQTTLTVGFGLAAVFTAAVFHSCQRSYFISEEGVQEFSWRTLRRSLSWDEVEEVRDFLVGMRLTGQNPDDTIDIPSMIAGYTDLRERILRRAPPRRSENLSEFNVGKFIIVGRVAVMAAVPAIGCAVCIAFWHWSAFICAALTIIGSRAVSRTVRVVSLHDHGLEVRRIVGGEVLPWSTIAGVSEQVVQLRGAYEAVQTAEMIGSLEIRLHDGRIISVPRPVEGIWNLREAIQQRIPGIVEDRDTEGDEEGEVANL
jgi:hypothetical protein